ncbi:MAG: Hsp20/alpha crystallin family protein [Rhodocyclaceae bacterium]|nr:Hsp20/alpha crystallin family protein [Rhodocyclaceae bacterium]
MERMSELKRGLQHTWESLAEGWQHVRDRAASALTHFRPTKPQTGEAVREASFPQVSWALLGSDVFEDQDRIVVRIEIPGMDKKDFEVEVHDEVLTVRGEKHFEKETTEGRYSVRQCAYGSFRRSIPLPLPVIAERAEARYRDGVLRIELPKAEHVRGRRIAIRSD